VSAHDVKVPKWGLTIERMTILDWLVAVGDVVEKGQPLCEVETDKSNSEIEAPVSGTVTAISGEPDTEYEVGAVIAAIDPS
jgi:2-oxoglutarate dehydrogenase E2 component (dihydrolipoamide succinyltransferase)